MVVVRLAADRQEPCFTVPINAKFGHKFLAASSCPLEAFQEIVAISGVAHHSEEAYETHVAARQTQHPGRLRRKGKGLVENIHLPGAGLAGPLQEEYTLLAEANLVAQSPIFPLQASDSATSLPLIPLRGISLSGIHLGMFAANVEEVAAVFFLLKISQGIGAQEREGMALSQNVPELFQAKRRIPLTARPQQCNHFAEAG